MIGVGFKKRGAFLRKSGPSYDPDRMHLHIICTDEQAFGTILVVSMCSLEPNTNDRACLLNIGDHRFIDRRSYIHYRKTEIMDLTALQELLRRGDIVPEEDCREDVFDRICEGLLASRAARANHKGYFRASREPFPEAA